jgi:hypothetical protein
MKLIPCKELTDFFVMNTHCVHRVVLAEFLNTIQAEFDL